MGREKSRGGMGSAKPLLLPPGNTRSLLLLLRLSASRPGFLASLTCGPSLHTRVVSSRCVPGPVVFLPPLACGVSPTASVDKAPRGASWWRRNVYRVRLWFHKAGGRGTDLERR